MKRITFLLFFILLFSTVSCNSKPADSTNTKGLVALGQLWGFLKYHHPAVAAGNYEWDMELMKQIPKVQKAKSDEEWKNILNDWINTLPPVTSSSPKMMPDFEIKQTPDYGELFNTSYFLSQTIAQIKHILSHATITSNHYISIDHGALNFEKEIPYAELSYPDTAHRLLALFRHWNIINYFSPNRYICDQKWSTVLQEMIPEFIYAKDDLAYYKTCEKLQAKIDDSHGFYTNNHDVYIQSIGTLHPPLIARFIKEKLVVIECLTKDECAKHNIKQGDIITSINAEPVDSIVKRRMPYIAASNRVALLRNISYGILTTNSDSIKLSIERETDKVEAQIQCYPFKKLSSIYQATRKKIDGYGIIDNNIGYVFPAACKVEERDKGIKKVLTGTQGLIIDLRCYPSDYISFSFLKHLNHRAFPYSLVSHMNVSYPGYSFIATKKEAESGNIIKKKNAYTKKIVVIVNEQTQSQAEDHVLGYQMATNVVVIGSTTAGANGATTRFSLPGGIYVTMSGKGVYYPDGSNLQRVGVKIDEVILPTISGIKEGRDEVLERAIEIIRLSNNHS